MIVACGDSMSVGVGDDDFNINPGSWVKYFCQMTGNRMIFMAKNGTTTRDFIEKQLPQILSMKEKPTHAFISIGGNDILRSYFSPSDIFDNVCKISIALKSISIEPVFVEIIDVKRAPTSTRIAKKVMSARCSEANLAVKSACKMTKTKLISLDDSFYHNDNFHIDGIHFNSRGYMSIALKAASLTQSYIVDYPVYMQKKWTNLGKVMWFITHATPWLMRRSVDLIPGLIYLYLKGIKK